VSYFRPQKARKIAPRSVCSLPNSTQKVSRKRGRVTTAKCAHPSCLISRVRSSGVPGLLICGMSAIGRTATMAGDLPTHGGNGSIQMSGDLTQRRTGGDPSRDVFSLRECEC
jgi:hypothetical protein